MNALAVLGAIVLFAGAGWLAWKALAPGRAVGTWPEAAARMGLVHTPDPVAPGISAGSMEGTYQGHRIRIQARPVQRRLDHMVVTVWFQAPLGAGLDLRSRSLPLDDAPQSERPAFETGDGDFDGRFRATASEPSRAARIFGSDAVRRAAEGFLASDSGLKVDDTTLTYVATSVEQDPARLRALADGLTALAADIERGARGAWS